MQQQYQGTYPPNQQSRPGQTIGNGYQAQQPITDQGIVPKQGTQMTVTQQERVVRATAFFDELRYLPLGGIDYFNNTGKLTDMQRLLQVLTNTAYMEAKTHSMITKRGAEKVQVRNQTQIVSAITKNDGNAFSLNRMLSIDNKQLGGQSKSPADGNEQETDFDTLQLEGAEKEEIEAQKILNKRQRRTGKIEEISIDIQSLFQNKKRFKPDAEAASGELAGASQDQQAIMKTITDDSRALLKRNLVNSYMEQVIEHDSANELILSKFKTMLKNIQVGNLTSIKEMQADVKAPIDVSKEEKMLIGFIIETEPELFSDVASYLLFSKFIFESAASNFEGESTSYGMTLEYLLDCFENNSNLALFNQNAFAKWILFLQKIPDLKSARFQTRVRQHFQSMLEKVKVSQIQQFYQCLVKQIIVSKLALKNEMLSFTMDHLIESLVSEEQQKSLAIFNLLFINKGESNVDQDNNGAQLQITEGNANQKTLFEQMQTSEKKQLKEAILRKFKQTFEVNQHTAAQLFRSDEARIVIKLFTHSHKSKADSEYAFQEYLRMCMQQQHAASSQTSENGSICLLQGLPDLLSTLEVKLKSNNDVVLKVLKLSMQSRNSKHLEDIQPFLGLLIDHFCKTETKVSLQFVQQVVKLANMKISGVDFTHFSFPLLNHLTTADSTEFSYLKQIMPNCFLHPGLKALIQGGQSPVVTPQFTIEIIEKLSAHAKLQVDLISLLIEKSPENLQQILSKQIVFSNIFISKFTPNLASGMQPSEYTLLLKKCLVTQLLESLIRHDKWTCRLLVRILLIFLKQATSITKQQKELESPIIDHGATIIDQILSKRLWDKGSHKITSGDWQNLKHGLIIFASNYQDNQKVKEIFQKHLPEESSIREEFSKDSDIMRNILGQEEKEVSNKNEQSLEKKSEKSQKSSKSEKKEIKEE